MINLLNFIYLYIYMNIKNGKIVKFKMKNLKNRRKYKIHIQL